ncbi:MAG: response regulator [Leptolyngbyaceae cyanobacterium MO_188.B28]|nr:response regulator [Leptolyngbyaceae cyanobacterium MO_188.B28]
MFSIDSEAFQPPVDILLVEDNAGDVFLIEHAMHGCSANCNIYLVQDGEAAMRFLQKTGEYATSPRPQLIFLDLNLPGKDGREVLEEIKADPNLMNIPVVVLTECNSKKDILRSYQNYANCYITKPFHLNQYNQTIKTITNFWLNYAQLPSKDLTGQPKALSGQPFLVIRS